jgi:hypothetical protein
LGKTVKELGLDDKQPFLPIEEHATLEQLLAARSGIYLPSSPGGRRQKSPRLGFALQLHGDDLHARECKV